LAPTVGIAATGFGIRAGSFNFSIDDISKFFLHRQDQQILQLPRAASAKIGIHLRQLDRIGSSRLAGLFLSSTNSVGSSVRTYYQCKSSGDLRQSSKSREVNLATRKNPERKQSGRFTVGRIDSVEKTCRKFLLRRQAGKKKREEGMNYVHRVRESKRSDHINAPNVKIGAAGFRQRKKFIKETRNELDCTNVHEKTTQDINQEQDIPASYKDCTDNIKKNISTIARLFG
jgi:hypothetical protein